MDKRFWGIAKQYCADKNIEWKCDKKNKDPETLKETRLRKLALYFNKDQQEFEEVVNENPDADVK